jgi:chemotaxis protein MotB
VARREVIIEPYEDTKKWLVTFNDLMTLLLTFFVLILSMSSSSAKNVKDFQQDLIEAIGVLEAGRAKEETIIEKIFKLEEIGLKLKIFKNIITPEEESIEEKDMVEVIPQPEKLLKDFVVLKEEGRKKLTENEEEYIFNQFQEIVDKDCYEPGLTIIKRDRGIVLRLADSILFDPGEVKVKDSAYPLLEKVAFVMKETKLNIYVEGHTDSQPIHTARYPSNWELSVARSVNVAEHMMQNYSIAAERTGVAGYGDSMPVVPNTNEENRSKNRRIEIILSKF